ncbi:hypothetical protein [Dyella sp.]|uniref:hypothetical protein n=1 Tax=Dyella sp. TaxID=1869338 RepID=UPI002ED2AD06
MFQSAPNLDFLKAAWSALSSISSRQPGPDYGAPGLSFQRINHSTIIRKGDVQLATMPLHYSRNELRVGFLGRIENEVRKAVAELETVLMHTLELPEGHRLAVELEEGMRALRRSANRMLTIVAYPEHDANPKTSVVVEMRVFLDSPRACLFAYHLDEQGDVRTDLLVDAAKRARMPRARSYGQLGQQIAQTLNSVLADLPSAATA